MHKEDTEMNNIFMYLLVSFVTIVSKEHEFFAKDKRSTKVWGSLREQEM